MVFWSGLLKKLRQTVSRREFNSLKNTVDTNTANISNKANTADVVLKSMSATTTITNTGNTIVSAPTVNITSRTGDLEFRVNDTTKSITCGGARIVNVANPTVRNGVATKGYVDTAIANIQPVANLCTLDTNQTITGIKTFSELLKIGKFEFKSDSAGLRIIPNSANNWLYFGATGQQYFQGIDLNNRVALGGIRNPVNSNDAVNKAYVDSKISTVNTALNNKANAADVYLKSQTYTRAEVDSKENNLSTRIDRKANISTVYTKTESDDRYLRKSDNYLIRTQSINATIKQWKTLGDGIWWYRFETSGNIDGWETALTTNVANYNLQPTRIGPGGFEVITTVSWSLDSTHSVSIKYVPSRSYF